MAKTHRVVPVLVRVFWGILAELDGRRNAILSSVRLDLFNQLFQMDWPAFDLARRPVLECVGNELAELPDAPVDVWLRMGRAGSILGQGFSLVGGHGLADEAGSDVFLQCVLVQEGEPVKGRQRCRKAIDIRLAEFFRDVPTYGDEHVRFALGRAQHA